MPRRRTYRNGGGRRGGRRDGSYTDGTLPPVGIDDPGPDVIPDIPGGDTTPLEDEEAAAIARNRGRWVLPGFENRSAWLRWLQQNRNRSRLNAPVIDKDRRKSLLAVYQEPGKRELRPRGGGGRQPGEGDKYGRADYFPANDPRSGKRALFGGRA